MHWEREGEEREPDPTPQDRDVHRGRKGMVHPI